MTLVSYMLKLQVWAMTLAFLLGHLNGGEGERQFLSLTPSRLEDSDARRVNDTRVLISPNWESWFCSGFALSLIFFVSQSSLGMIDNKTFSRTKAVCCLQSQRDCSGIFQTELMVVPAGWGSWSHRGIMEWLKWRDSEGLCPSRPLAAWQRQGSAVREPWPHPFALPKRGSLNSLSGGRKEPVAEQVSAHRIVKSKRAGRVLAH